MCSIYVFVKVNNCHVRAYGSDIKALNYIKSYVDKRKQRARVNSNFSSWQEIFARVPQGSILEPLLFNIFVNDLFVFVSSSRLSIYANDNTLYATDYNLEDVKETLHNDLNKVTKWFHESYMVLNAGKCHFIWKNTENETFIFKDTIMDNSKEEKVLGVTIDNKLTFSCHIRELCKKLLKKYRLCQEYQTNLMILKKAFLTQ